MSVGRGLATLSLATLFFKFSGNSVVGLGLAAGATTTHHVM